MSFSAPVSLTLKPQQITKPCVNLHQNLLFVFAQLSASDFLESLLEFYQKMRLMVLLLMLVLVVVVIEGGRLVVGIEVFFFF